MLSLLRDRCPASLEIPEAVWRDIERAYQTPPRHYHTLEHVVEVAGWFDWVASGSGWQHPHEVFLAVLYHDAIYHVGQSDNEARSALLARTSLAEWSGGGVDSLRVAQLIELTAHHGKTMAVDEEIAHFLDCDMAILGAAPDEFARYEAAVEREYTAVLPLAVYRRGRTAFLSRVLEQPHIFLSPLFRSRLEAAARANLEGSLARSAAG